jgi:hypothetical protein
MLAMQRQLLGCGEQSCDSSLRTTGLRRPEQGQRVSYDLVLQVLDLLRDPAVAAVGDDIQSFRDPILYVVMQRHVFGADSHSVRQVERLFDPDFSASVFPAFKATFIPCSIIIIVIGM